MKTIEVVAAVIEADGKILATQRGSGEFAGMWEFPGGKIESGETQVEALVREIKEELDIEISVGEFIMTVEYDYPNFHLIMHCYQCNIQTGELVLKEHKNYQWLEHENLMSVEWLPADIPVVNKIQG